MVISFLKERRPDDQVKQSVNMHSEKHMMMLGDELYQCHVSIIKIFHELIRDKRVIDIFQKELLNQF